MRHGLKKGISARELHDSFTLSLDEIAWVRGQTRSHEAELVLAVLLKAHQRLAYFPKLEDVPAKAVEHVRGVWICPPRLRRSGSLSGRWSGTGSGYVTGSRSLWTSRRRCGSPRW
jgi:hypothetical protein